ncbi:uncharacterized protein LOC141786412 [Halichoeres trimaculatus]|uniref:uncharacterized protein LOC141786412 n=1 Tax=Halichoeres trimaculatus TaxID=147232 RepID=UPI003D9F7FF6
MAGLWMTWTLVFLLTGGSAAVDQNQLARLVKGLKDEYRISGMFSLALSIPSEDPANLRQIFTDNPKTTVEQTVNGGGVYQGARLAVAAPQDRPPVHAERRVLLNLQLQSNPGDLLVIYSYASPCNHKCTNINNPYNILGLIGNVINAGNWGGRVFVFEKVFVPHGPTAITEAALSASLQALGRSGIGLANIFRCFRPNNSRNFECSSCSSGAGVTRVCVDRNAK